MDALVEVREHHVRGAEFAAAGVAGAQGVGTVGGVEHQHALGDFLAIEEGCQRLIGPRVAQRQRRQVEIDEAAGRGGRVEAG